MSTEQQLGKWLRRFEIARKSDFGAFERLVPPVNILQLQTVYAFKETQIALQWRKYDNASYHIKLAQ